MSFRLSWSISIAALMLACLASLAACGAPGPTSPAPAASASTSVSPAATSLPSAPPPIGPVTTPADALDAVVALEPRLTGISVKDPNLIGQSSWVEVVPGSGVGAFLVNVRVGWGDCPAGCINEHSWTYIVEPDGTVLLQTEAGDIVPPDAWPSPGGDGRTGILVSATSAPTCPVERLPPEPSCAPRPVPGAVAIIRDGSGQEVARATLDARGLAFVELPAGGYVVEPQPVEGLMGTPGAVGVTVVDGVGVPVPLSYDTGIR